MNDEFVPLIAELKELEYLDLSRPGTSFTSAAAVDLFNAVGKNLTHLNLSGHDDLTDALVSFIICSRALLGSNASITYFATVLDHTKSPPDLSVNI